MATYLAEVSEFARTRGAKDKQPRKKRGFKKSAWIGALGAGGVLAGLAAGKGKGIVRGIQGGTKGKILKKIRELDKAADAFAKRAKAKGRQEMNAEAAHKTLGTWKKRKQLHEAYGDADIKDMDLTREDMKKWATRLGLGGIGGGLITKPFLQSDQPKKQKRKQFYREPIYMPGYYYYSTYSDEVAEFARTRGAKDKKKRKPRSQMTTKEKLAEDEKLKYAAGRGAKAGALGGALQGGLSGAAAGALQGGLYGSAAGGPPGTLGGAAIGAGVGGAAGAGIGALTGAPGGAINAAWAKRMEKRYRKKLLKGKKNKK